MMKPVFVALIFAMLAACGADEHHPDGAPEITAVVPDFGPVGSSIQIRGRDFGGSRDYRAVRFGTIEARINSANDNVLQVEVPDGAVRGDLSLVVNARASNTQVFTVTQSLSARWVSIMAGSLHSCGILADKTLRCWGRNLSGQLGIGSSRPFEIFPIAPSPASGWGSIAPGAYLNDGNTCGVRIDGALWCWGDNQLAQFGNATFDASTEPLKIGAAKHWLQVGLGGTSTCALTQAKLLYCWGLGAGSNHHNYPETPELVPSALPWNSLSLGYGSRCGIQSDGSLWCWGDNTTAQLGLGHFDDEFTPTRVGSGTEWTTVSVGGSKAEGHACALTNTSELWCWGDNRRGQVGNGTFATQSRPVSVGGASWKAVAAGAAHTCAIKLDGSLWCWGSNQSLQLGQPQASEFNVPVRVGKSADWSQVSLGTSHTCGIKENGSLWCWGSNLEGQLGVPGVISTYEPLRIQQVAVR